MPDTKKDPFAEVELFRAGNYGPKGTFTSEDLEIIAKNSDPSTEAMPITTDHKQNGPAMGWLLDVWHRAGSLFGKLNPHSEFAKMVKEGVFKTRSIELYRGKNPRVKAITFLGAAAPAVKGMASIFSENPDGVVSFADNAPAFERFDLEDESAFDCFAATKREKGIDFPPRAFLHVPDVNAPSTWKLRVWENLEKKVTRRQLGLAAAAFAPGGFRGRRVQLPASKVRPIKRNLKTLYKNLGVPDEQVPAQIRNFSEDEIEVDGKVFFAEHFASLRAGYDTGLLMYSDPDGDPDSKCLGRAISYFSPGGYGVEQAKIISGFTDYMEAKANIIDACSLIGKDPAWADWQISDIFWDEQITDENLRNARPDIYTSITGGTLTEQEDTQMSEELKELQVKFEAQGVELKAANEATEAQIAKNEEITNQYNETKEKLETQEKEQAMAAMQEDLKTRVDKAELPELFANDVLAQFSNADNLDTLNERIEKVKELAAFNAPTKGIEGNGEGEAAPSDSGVNAEAEACAKAEGIDFRDALIKVSKK